MILVRLVRLTGLKFDLLVILKILTKSWFKIIKN
jgi:hypothetical protein